MSDPLGRKRPDRRALRAFCTLVLTAAACQPAPITIRAGLLLDGQGGHRRDALITVTNGRITAVEPWQGDSATYDLSRYTVLPGLIDAHVHISGYFNHLGQVGTSSDGESPAERAAARAANARATVLAGFTTVASMGSGADRELRELIARGTIPGPRILTSTAQIWGPNETVDSLRDQVRLVAARGADFVKILASSAVRDGGRPVLTGVQLAALCGEARRLKLRSVVHAHDDASIRQAAAAGCDQVEHGFTGSATGFKVLADSGVSYDPQCGLLLRNYLEHRTNYEGMPGFPPSEFDLLERLAPTLPGLLRAALATPGLTVLYGTDATAGAHGRNAEDLVCRVREAGDSPMNALVSATSRNAGALGLGTEIGTIAPGYQADLIGLEGDPLQEIEAVRRVRFVMKGGQVIFRSLDTLHFQ